MHMKKIICGCLVVFLILGITAGCKKKNEDSGGNIANMDAIKENTMPITKELKTLSVWMPNKSQGYAKNYGDMIVFQKLEEETGVKLEFQHPTGAEKEQLNIILASNEYPDIIFSHWENTGLKQLADGVCIDLTPYIEKVAPNLNNYLNENPSIKKELIMTDGKIVYIPRIVDDEKFLCYDGYFIRKDWLDAVGMNVPTTIDEWYTVLKKFKTADLNNNGKQDEIPFSTLDWMFRESFTSAFGFSKFDFCFDDKTGKITHAALKPEFKEYLQTMNKWYAEGLLNPNFLKSNSKELDSLVLNNRVGAFYIDNNNSMPKYMQLNPDLKLAAVPYPKGKNGKAYYPNTAITRKVRGDGVIITTSCQDPVLAVRYFDHLFEQEASDLLNWGVEGESYKVDSDGKKSFTDAILANPEGKKPYESICKYMTNTGFVGFLQYGAAKGLENNLPENVKALKQTSVEMALDSDKSLLLPSIKYTVEEGNRKSEKEEDINSYIEEMVAKFILGKESFDHYQVFVDTLKEMGIEEIIDIMQTSYDRAQQ